MFSCPVQDVDGRNKSGHDKATTEKIREWGISALAQVGKTRAGRYELRDRGIFPGGPFMFLLKHAASGLTQGQGGKIKLLART